MHLSKAAAVIVLVCAGCASASAPAAGAFVDDRAFLLPGDFSEQTTLAGESGTEVVKPSLRPPLHRAAVHWP